MIILISFIDLVQIVPRSPPTTVAVNGVSPTTIMVSWGPVPLIDQNGIITEYEVMYEPLETFNGSIVTQRVNVTEPEMSVTLMELQEFVNYSISVRAYTSVGAGPYSSGVYAMTNESGEYSLSCMNLIHFHKHPFYSSCQ